MERNKILKLGLVVGLLISLISIGGCAPAGENGGGEGSMVPMIVFLVLIFGMLYFVMIRPQRKRQKEHQQLMEELKKGDRVITAGGVYGVIESLSEDSIVLKIESGATMRVTKGSILGKRNK